MSQHLIASQESNGLAASLTYLNTLSVLPVGSTNPFLGSSCPFLGNLALKSKFWLSARARGAGLRVREVLRRKKTAEKTRDEQ
jgi:hypothetical protein